MEQVEPLMDIIALLSDMGSDQHVPKNVRVRMQNLIGVLQSSKEHSVKVHEAMNSLDAISNDINLDSYTRTQLFSVISMLEKMH
jgi:uncharacterized protein (UPF0147 family)